MIETVKPDWLSDELLDAEIPCVGISFAPIARSCSRPAVLRTFGHGCRPMNPWRFKCLACFKVWYAYNLHLLQFGPLRCGTCKREFSDIESFSDYRPL
jgi:hypothetical protein